MSDEITVIFKETPTQAVVKKSASPITISSSGPQGPTGPQGLPGAAGGTVYVHNQTTPAATWIIDHNVGRKVSVTLYDDSGNVVITDIQHGTVNQATVTWSSPTTGSALIV